jgi:hypothetical protein
VTFGSVSVRRLPTCVAFHICRGIKCCSRNQHRGVSKNVLTADRTGSRVYLEQPCMSFWLLVRVVTTIKYPTRYRVTHEWHKLQWIYVLNFWIKPETRSCSLLPILTFRSVPAGKTYESSTRSHFMRILDDAI